MKPQEARELCGRLNHRQAEILQFAAAGFGGDETAAHLKISKSGVSKARADIIYLLNVSRLQVACTVACKAGLI